MQLAEHVGFEPTLGITLDRPLAGECYTKLSQCSKARQVGFEPTTFSLEH